MFRNEHVVFICTVEDPAEREKWYVILEVGSGTGIRANHWTLERTFTPKIGTADSFETTRRHIPADRILIYSLL
jgi:hypothetical protein